MKDAALAFLAEGWALTPLHWIEGGRCSCGNPRNDPDHDWKHGGKHPLLRRWQAEPLQTPEQIIEAWANWPKANIGGITGPASGRWVLDMDPDNGARFEDLPRLAEEPTRIHQSGSGGKHFIFTIEDGWTPSNAPGLLPPGWDVRGLGGQVVLPPSRTLKGEYLRLNAAPTKVAGPWLRDTIRPPRPQATTKPRTDQTRAPGDLQAARLAAYGETSMAARLDELRGTPPGGRNQAAFNAACRLIELINGGMLDGEHAQDEFLSACQDLNTSGPSFSQGEALQTWRSATSRVGGKSAELPADTLHGHTFTPTAPEPPRPDSPAPEAPRSRFGRPGPVPTEPALPLGGRLLTPDQLIGRPLPPFLVRSWLNMHSESWMIAPPGHFKSFVAMDMAAHVALGIDWCGHKVRQVPVMYIMAEGDDFASARFEAWQLHHHMNIENFYILPESPNIADPAAWAEIIDAAAELGIGLFIIDTQSRITEGLEENTAKDMGRYVKLVREIKVQTGACVLSIHHTNPDGTRGRGSTVQDGAQDSCLMLTRPVGTDLLVELSDKKQKNMATDKVLRLKLKVVNLGWKPGQDCSVDSLVVEGVAPDEQLLLPEFGASAGIQQAIIAAVHLSSAQGLTQAAAKSLVKGVDPRDFLAAWVRMVEAGILAPSALNPRAYVVGEVNPDA